MTPVAGEKLAKIFVEDVRIIHTVVLAFALIMCAERPANTGKGFDCFFGLNRWRFVFDAVHEFIDIA